MYKFIIGLALLATFTVSSAFVTGWENCGSPMANIQHVYLTNCDQAPCTIIRGQPHDISFEAIANHGNERLYYRVSTSVLGLQITLHEGTACNSIFIGTCPIRHNDRFRLGLHFSVSSNVPQISSIINILVFNDRGETQFPHDVCINLPVQIRDS